MKTKTHKSVKILIFSSTLLLISFQSLSSQYFYTPKKLKNISFYGTTNGIATPLNLSFDLFGLRKNSYHGITTGITYVFGGAVDHDFGIHLTYTYLSKARFKNHFEFKLGGTLIDIYDPFVIPVVTLGYRYQKPGDKSFLEQV